MSRGPAASALLLTPLLCIVLGASVHADSVFSTPTMVPIGHAVYSIAVADLNGDQLPDLAVATNGGISVALGNGDGTFQPKYDFGPGCSSIATADFNGDGKADLAILPVNVVSVLLGNGDGTFQPQVNYPVQYSPDAVVVADVNGDGRPDLVVTNYSSSTVSVLLGNGDGTFQPQIVNRTSTEPRGVALADLNADGHLDMVVADDSLYYDSVHNTGLYYYAHATVFLGNGDGTFVLAGLYHTGSELDTGDAIADLNGDGRPDLVTLNQGFDTNPTAQVSVMLGNGDGTFGPRTFWGTGPSPSAVGVADFDADGHSDLAVACGNALSVRFGSGDGTFANGASYGGRGTMTIADVNLDGRPDVVMGSLDTYPNALVDVAVMLSTSGGGGIVTPTTGIEPHAVAIIDLSHDGSPDLAIANYGSNSLSVVRGNGNGRFGTKSDFAAGSHPDAVAVGHFDADYFPDVVTANSGSNTVSVLLGTTDGSLGPKVDFATGSGPASVAVADLNVDGYDDVVVANSGSNTVSVLLGNGDGTFAPKIDTGTGDAPRSVAIGDFNSDGCPDLAVANSGSNTVSILLGSCDGTFGTRSDVATGSDPYSVAVGRIDADSRLDLVVANRASNTISVLLGSGDGTFLPRTDHATPADPVAVTIGDFDQDGAMDVAVACDASNAVSILPGIGEGGLGVPRHYSTYDGPLSVAAGDLNGDSVPDVVAANSGSNNVTVIINRAGPAAISPTASAAIGEAVVNLVAPNPARAISRIEYTVARAGHVRLDVADVAGRVVTTLFDGIRTPGHFQASWDGTNRGARLPAGIYFVRLGMKDRTVTRTIARLR